MTHVQNVTRASEWILPSIAASDNKFDIQARDVIQVYTQAKSKMAHKFFISLSHVFRYPSNFLFTSMLHIFGLSELGLNWFYSFTGYHTKNLRMTMAIYNICFMYKEKFLLSSSQSLSFSKGFYACKTITPCTPATSPTQHKRDTRNYGCKPFKLLKHSDKLKFNSATIAHCDRSYSVSQPNHIKKLNPIDNENETTAASFPSEAVMQTAPQSRETIYAFSVETCITKLERNNFKVINNFYSSMLDSTGKSSFFMPLDLDSTVMAVFMDAEFCSNPDSTS